jgi:hypothetical protein
MSDHDRDRPVRAADLDELRGLIQQLFEELYALLRGRLPAVPLSLRPQWVTLNQMAAVVHRSKRTLERFRRHMPAPRVLGRRGRPHLWDWPEVRPWLEATFGLQLPERYPGIPP